MRQNTDKQIPSHIMRHGLRGILSLLSTVMKDVWLAEIAREEEKEFRCQTTWWEEDVWNNEEVGRGQTETERRYQTDW